MRKKFKAIAKECNATIVGYNTYKSDMGMQVYEIKLLNVSGKLLYFIDSAYRSEKGNEEYLLESFKNKLSLNK